VRQQGPPSEKPTFTKSLLSTADISQFSHYYTGVDGASVDPIYYGNWTVTTLGSGTKDDAKVNIFSNGVYKYFFQDLFRVNGRSFPAIPQFQTDGGEWMTQDQEKVTTLYGWTSVGVLAIVVLNLLWGWYQSFRGLFRSTYEVRTRHEITKATKQSCLTISFVVKYSPTETINKSALATFPPSAPMFLKSRAKSFHTRCWLATLTASMKSCLTGPTQIVLIRTTT
jgi:hypothetical protein